MSCSTTVTTTGATNKNEYKYYRTVIYYATVHYQPSPQQLLYC